MKDILNNSNKRKKALFVSYSHGWNKRYQPFINALKDNYGFKTLNIVSDFNHATKKRVKNRLPGISYIHVPKYKKNLSIMRIMSLIIFAIKSMTVIKHFRPDLIYVVLPPNILGRVCTKYIRKHSNTIFIVDIIDLWPESLPIKGYDNFFAYKLWKKMRDDCLKNADYVLTECNLYIKTLNHILGRKKTDTLYLYKKQAESEKTVIRESSISYKCSPSIRLAYLGSINHIISINDIVSIMQKIKKMNIDVSIDIIGDGEKRDEFLNRLKKAGCKYTYHGIVYEQNKIAKILCVCDYGINLMTEQVVVGLTMKSIDYFSFGLPIINNIKGDTWELVQKNDIGFNVTSGRISQQDIEHICSRTLKKSSVFDFFDLMFSEKGYYQKVNSILISILRT
ncbi:MAG: hypothetical protein K6F27_00355 [Ruminococcus sp.]|nr:hypothetical protein [Ruminococcus sp.]